MWGWIVHLDRLLRGETTSLASLERGEFRIPIFGMSFVIAALGVIYGACMGVFAVTRNVNPLPMQVPASMVKVPLLFFLTLVVTFPSLYVFNALVGSRLTFGSVLRLLIGGLAVTLTVLASLGPIVAFFSVSTTSYAFMKLLNVIVFALSGCLGLSFLLQTLHRMAIAQAPTEPPPIPTEVITDPNDPRFTGLPVKRDIGALDRIEGHVLGRHTRTIFRIWVIVFGLVGAQMAWVLRPFIGNPDAPFVWFRGRQSNFFEAMWELLTGFFGGR